MDSSSKGAILITGASTGIGKDAALRMSSLGYTVFAGVRKKDDAQALTSEDSKLNPIILDVTKSEQITAAVEELSSKVGGRGLAGLVNNAGIGIGAPIEFLQIDELRRQFEVNLFGLVELTQAFIELIRIAQGRIVNISSLAGKVSQPYMAPYCASKHALEAISDSLRQELRPWNIDVAIIEPGAIETPIWDKADEMANQNLKKLPLRGQELYGRPLQALNKTLKSVRRSSVPASHVSDAIEHALSSRKPRTRYPVGKDAKAATFLRRFISDRAFDALMRSQFK